MLLVTKLIKHIFWLALLALLSGCAGSPHAIVPADNGIQRATHKAYIYNHGWHTSIILPAQAVQEKEPALKQRFPHATYLGFGWGDEDVYQADETRFWPSTHAILLPTHAVLHVVATHKPKLGEHTALLCLGDIQQQSLIDYILSSFARDGQQGIMHTALDDGANSQFYDAQGTYYFLNTCNTWTAKALASAGLDISPVFYPTASQVMHYIKSLNQTCPKSPE